MNKTLPGVSTFIDNLANVQQARPQIPTYPKISTALANMVVSVLVGSAQPQAALTTAAQKVDQILSSGNSAEMTAPPTLLRRADGTGGPRGARREVPRRRRGVSEHIGGWLFATPATVIIVLFGAVPIIWSIVLSFEHVPLGSGGRFIGTANYRELAHDPVVRQAIGHTFIYTALFVPLTMIIGFSSPWP